MHYNEKATLTMLRQLPSRDYLDGFEDGIHDRMPPDAFSDDYRLGFRDGQDMLFGDESESDESEEAA